MSIARTVRRFVALVATTAALPAAAGNPRSGGDDLPLGEFVDIHCLDCHRGRDATGDVDLAALVADPTAPTVDPDLLRRVRDRLRARDMPPVDVSQPLEARIADRPTEAEYEAMVAAVGDELARRADGAGVPGVVLRRLNRREFAAAVEDVFGIVIDAGVLPADDVGHGFDHLGEVLSTSPLLVEKIVDLAEDVARRSIIDRATDLPDVRVVPLRDLEGARLMRGGAWKSSNGEVFVDLDLPRPGRYRAEFDLAGRQAGDQPVRFALRLDRRTRRRVEVPETPDQPSTHVFEFTSEAVGVRLGAAFLNDYYAPNDPDPAQRDRNAVVTGVRLVGPLDPGDPTDFQRRFDGWMRQGDRRTGLARAARRLLERCWCRPIPADEAFAIADLMLEVAAEADAEDPDSGTGRVSTPAVQQALVVYAISSPEFLYRVERGAEDASPRGDGTEPLDAFAIATRLGAFLRGGLPDERLLEAARRGVLDEEEGIRREVRRLLRGDAPRSLAERFAVQWLHVDGIERVEPDPERFGPVEPGTLADMREETVRAFEEVVREGRPVTDLLHHRTSWLTPRLATHYGLDPVEMGFRPGDAPNAWRRVDLAEAGVIHADLGILRHGSVLASTSNPGRTSPVKRGRWVLESLLDCPPPPPPPGVAPLPEQAEAMGEHASLRDMLEAHRADPDCAACHVRMDALGFALEPFDAVGRWRTRDDDRPIDASATFPDGSTVDGPLDLRAVLVEDPAFRRSFAKHLLVYALGRGPEWRDEPLVDRLVAVLESDPSVGAVVEAIAVSDAFRRRPMRKTASR